MSFTFGRVTVELLDGLHQYRGVPTSQWRGDRQERTGDAVLANVTAPDGLRAQVALVTWPGGDEVSLRLADLLGGPADYERLEDAGEMSPKNLGDTLVARIRVLRYGASGRAAAAAVEWDELDAIHGAPVRDALAGLGAVRTGNYAELYPHATRFKSEPAIEVRVSAPAALFAVYALTRVTPIMTGYGRVAVEGPHA